MIKRQNEISQLPSDNKSSNSDIEENTGLMMPDAEAIFRSRGGNELQPWGNGLKVKRLPCRHSYQHQYMFSICHQSIERDEWVVPVSAVGNGCRSAHAGHMAEHAKSWKMTNK